MDPHLVLASIQGTTLMCFAGDFAYFKCPTLGRKKLINYDASFFNDILIVYV